ncbi:retrotransposable element protein [Planoprotostelium fungivorum]|uniref:Retrotransposable element protein n=1 Tax=Planoprotostelium fungivorum TaxID=1890364 RepID=A0A2P6N658_9EUKA|nr:retrotransposable element protein [Planoprotostelium fungivorum]
MRNTADQHRREAPVYQPGDKVFISTKNIRTTRPKKKLDYKWIGPYPITKAVGTHAYEVELPRDYLIHNVFHVSQLRPVETNRFKGRNPPAPQPVEILPDGGEIHEIDEILDSRVRRNKLEYFIKYKDTEVNENEWLPHYDVYAYEAIKDFHRRYPARPGPISKLRGEYLEPLQRLTQDVAQEKSTSQVSHSKAKSTAATLPHPETQEEPTPEPPTEPEQESDTQTTEPRNWYPKAAAAMIFPSSHAEVFHVPTHNTLPHNAPLLRTMVVRTPARATTIGLHQFTLHLYLNSQFTN